MKISLTKHISSFPIRVAKREGFFQSKNIPLHIIDSFTLDSSLLLLENNKVDSAEVPFTLFFSKNSSKQSVYSILEPILPLYLSKLNFFSRHKPESLPKSIKNWQIPVLYETSIEQVYIETFLKNKFYVSSFKYEEIPFELMEEYTYKEECLGIACDTSTYPFTKGFVNWNNFLDNPTILDGHYPINLIAFTPKYIQENTEKVVSFIQAVEQAIAFINEMKDSKLDKYLKVIDIEGLLDSYNYEDLKRIFLNKDRKIENIYNTELSEPILNNIKNLYLEYLPKNNHISFLSSLKVLNEKLIQNAKNPRSSFINLAIDKVKNKDRSKDVDDEGVLTLLEDEYTTSFNLPRKIFSGVKAKNIIQSAIKKLIYKCQILLQKNASLKKELLHAQNELNEIQENGKTEGQSFIKLFKSSSDLLLVVDKITFALIEYNQKFCEETGYNRRELSDKKLIDFLKGIHSAEDLNEVILKAENPNYISSLEFIHREGHYLFVDLNIASIIHNSKDCFLIQVINTSEQRETLRLKHQFISSISHELRSPMTNIKGYWEILSRDPSVNFKEEHKDILNTIFRNINRMNDLIENLLKLDMNEGMQVTGIEEIFKAIDVINEVVEAHSQTIREKNLKLVLELDSRVNLNANRSDFYKIINNLYVNAIKYTSKGEIKIKLEVSVNRLCLITVSDTGIGIDPKYSIAIFEKFFRVPDNNNRKIGGTGLGLSIVQSITLKMGGNILLDTEYKNGCRFFVYLPRLKIEGEI